MKVLLDITTSAQCFMCKKSGFFVQTPDGADYTTCPLCTKRDYASTLPYTWNDDMKYNDMRIMYSYCSSCKIMFDYGCIHAICGCTDDVYNAHFIKQWKDLQTGEIYTGMPQFDNNQDWYDNANNVQVLGLVCINTEGHIEYCQKAYHSKPPNHGCNTDILCD